MRLTERHAAGREYLDMVTRLLQQIRVDAPGAGLWEAADMQWAWRKDQHRDPSKATFWIDESDEVVAGVVITDWGAFLGGELLVHPDAETLILTMWSNLLDSLTGRPRLPLEVSIRDDDAVLIGLATGVGFAPSEVTAVTSSLAASDRPPVTEIAEGYRLRSRAETPDVLHHMVKRNGVDVGRRLQECSLYEPALDLFVEAPDGSVAAYGLFWPDSITGVGLVEPMRTEDEHQGRGLARHILTAGIERLASSGCTRMKITFMNDNPVSEHVYLSSGFVPESTTRAYRRPTAD